MAKASILNQLKDDDLEIIRHMIRRDAMTDLQIAQEVAKRLATKAQRQKAQSEAAASMTIARYRNSKPYRDWLKRWENQDVELKKVIETQKQRFELVSNLVKNPDAGGIENISKSLQARLLALAAETDDENLKQAAGGKGWVASILKLTQDGLNDEYHRKVESLKSEICRLMAAPKGIKIKSEDLVKKVDEVMGISAAGGSARGGKNA